MPKGGSFAKPRFMPLACLAQTIQALGSGFCRQRSLVQSWSPRRRPSFTARLDVSEACAPAQLSPTAGPWKTKQTRRREKKSSPRLLVPPVESPRVLSRTIELACTCRGPPHHPRRSPYSCWAQAIGNLGLLPRNIGGFGLLRGRLTPDLGCPALICHSAPRTFSPQLRINYEADSLQTFPPCVGQRPPQPSIEFIGGTSIGSYRVAEHQHQIQYHLDIAYPFRT